MWRRLRGMLIKEFYQMFRDVRMRIVVFGMPLIQLTVLAFALTTDVKEIRTALLDEDASPESRRVIAAFEGSGYFRIVAHLPSQRTVAEWLDADTVQAVFHFQPGFEAALRTGRGAQFQIITDGTYNNDTAFIFNYARQILSALNQELAGEAPMLLATRSWYNPNLESKYYYVPGLIAVMLLVISMMLTSIAIVREKEIGTIEQIMVTPIRRSEFILGKTIPFLLTGLITMSNMLLIAWPLFNLHVQGNLALLYLVAMFYIGGNLAIALLISVSAQTQQQALLTTFLILLPAVLLSGFIFPIRNMPPLVQLVTYLNPVRWFLENLHGIVVRGVGLETLWKGVIAQAGLAVCFGFLSVARFRKTLP
jgi:ABC-2 type transport system permease protein